MDVGTFRAWLSGMDDLTTEQREEVQEILDGREPGEEVTSAIEDRLTAERCCPHCGTGSGVKRGSANGFAAVPLQSLRQELQCPDRDAPGPAAPQGALARFRPVAEGGRHGPGIGRALRRRRGHGVSVASPFPAGVQDRDRAAARHRRSRRNLPSG